MTRIALLAVCLSSGCMLYFNDSDDEPPICALDTAGPAELAGAPLPLRDPYDLTCDTFGGGGCDPACGPCAEAAHTPPLPSWNYCGHKCDTLGEGACAADPECRVVKDARCSISLDCETDFIGCFPTDTQQATIDCERSFDAWDCSRSNACSALHYGAGAAAHTSPEFTRPFAMCVTEGTSPGLCWAPVACDANPPSCPQGTTAAVRDLCYTGGCIPLDICEPR